MMAGMAITAADPSGLWGLLKESFASGSALARAMTDPGSNPLVKALATDFSTSEARSAARDGLKAKLANSKTAELKTKSIEALRQVSAVLGAKAPGDAAAFKRWLRQISQATAEAASEGGGLLGLGGVQVSEAEKATPRRDLQCPWLDDSRKSKRRKRGSSAVRALTRSAIVPIRTSRWRCYRRSPTEALILRIYRSCST